MNNTGTIQKTSGTGVTQFGDGLGDVVLNNNGLLDVQSGTLRAGGSGGNSTGNFQAASGAVLEFSAGAHNFNAGSSVAGAGMFRTSGSAGVIVAGNYSVATTQITGGTLSVNSNVSTATLDLSGGVLAEAE